MIERRVIIHRVTDRYPTGEIRSTVDLGPMWVPIDATPPNDDIVWASPSDSYPAVRTVK